VGGEGGKERILRGEEDGSMQMTAEWNQPNTEKGRGKEYNGRVHCKHVWNYGNETPLSHIINVFQNVQPLFSYRAALCFMSDFSYMNNSHSCVQIQQPSIHCHYKNRKLQAL
jgi:hypothetical protein